MRVFVTAVCDTNCARCVTNGPGKCDDNHCNDGYIYNNETQTCEPVCDASCSRCVTNGPGKCDDNHCNDGYNYTNETQTCDGT
ncbi:hypothetical protein LSAT2_030216, partial [Lamellibrachia satsuma]